MKQFLFIMLLLLLLQNTSYSQLWKMKRLEVTGGIGTTQFFGDIGGFSQGENILGIKDFILSQTRFNISSSARYRILSPVAIRINLAGGYFHSSDAKGSNSGRAFESSTLFFEPSAIAEYYLLRNRAERTYHFMKGIGLRKQQKRSHLVDLYLFSGIGQLFYKVNPNEKLESYITGSGGHTLIIPAGIGASLNTGDYYFGAELGGRYTFSDNIDGYTSIYSKSNDIYFLLNLIFTYKIRTKENGLPEFIKSKGRR